MNQIKNKRSNTKVRCIADISIENCVKVNANSIQNDHYIADIAIYGALAQAVCKYYGKTALNKCIIEKVNGLFKYIHPSDYRNVLIEIANSLTQETDIEIYTDGSMKNIATNKIMMGCAFVISAPIKKSFNCGIADNPSSNKAELIAVILSLMTCPKATNVEIYSDSQWVVNTFDDLNFLTIKDIERSKVNYKVLWLCLFKIIRIYSLKVKITKVKAHSDCDYNKEADKLAKSGAEKNVLIIEDKLLLHNGTVCWRDMPIERNPILMIKGIKDAQFIEDFLMLYRNEVYRQSDLL
ncbi:ribonuclease H-like protein, partial [Rhizophagus irregularis]